MFIVAARFLVLFGGHLVGSFARAVGLTTFAFIAVKILQSLGAVIILVLWFYVTGMAFLVGREINATIEHAAAGHGHIEAKAPGQKAA